MAHLAGSFPGRTNSAAVDDMQAGVVAAIDAAHHHINVSILQYKAQDRHSLHFSAAAAYCVVTIHSGLPCKLLVLDARLLIPSLISDALYPAPASPTLRDSAGFVTS